MILHHPAIVLTKSKAYMNHKFTDGREKTVRCGIKFVDPRTHFREEHQNPAIRQMILNTIIWDGHRRCIKYRLYSLFDYESSVILHTVVRKIVKFPRESGLRVDIR
jgi:hypothetical protein